jgi:hypothetical protein
MEQSYRIAGDIEKTNMEILNEILSSTDMKVRLKNDENLYITNECIDLHIYESMRNPLGNYNYLVGGTIEGELELVEKIIREIASLLENRDIVYNFEFYEECEAGDVSEEFQIKHPNF